MNYRDYLYFVVNPTNAALMVILNVVEIFFIWKMQLIKKSKSTIFMVNLSLADIFVGLVISGIKLTFSFNFPTDHIVSKICKYLKTSLIQVTLMVSILTNVVLTSERLLLVKSPIRYKQFTKRHRVWICLGMWVIVMLVYLALYFKKGALYEKQLFIACMVFVSLPWSIICFVLIKRTINQGLSKKYQTSGSNTTNNYSTSQQNNANEKKFLLLCYRTFIVFAVCWVPYSIYGCLGFLKVLSDNKMDPNYKYLQAAQSTVRVIAFMNSVINPITYLFTYNFLRRICKSCKSRKPKVGEKRKTAELVSMSASRPATKSTSVEDHITPK